MSALPCPMRLTGRRQDPRNREPKRRWLSRSLLGAVGRPFENQDNLVGSTFDVGRQCLDHPRPVLGLHDVEHAALPGNCPAKGRGGRDQTIALRDAHGPLGGIPQNVPDLLAPGSVRGAHGQVVLGLDAQTKGQLVADLDDLAVAGKYRGEPEPGNDVRVGGGHAHLDFEELILGKERGGGTSLGGGGGSHKCVRCCGERSHENCQDGAEFHHHHHHHHCRVERWGLSSAVVVLSKRS
mmetsp:Transcript_2629/g.6989  ORF Transcript_2629/g.6989 Transcript_2629/m.6989 type:complete len:238 (-) Transcript_2629:259-972(-)